MSVACDCSTDGDWYYYGPSDFQVLDTKRSRKCYSCGERIAVGDECASFPRYRPARDDFSRASYIEQTIYGDEVPVATWYACETCAGVYFSITELGYCVMIGDGMTMKQNAQQVGAIERLE
jgi:hypothetical protein